MPHFIIIMVCAVCLREDIEYIVLLGAELDESRATVYLGQRYWCCGMVDGRTKLLAAMQLVVNV
jgi:hypothetical protein